MLYLALLVSAVTMVWTLLALPGSAEQLGARLEREWRLGQLRVEARSSFGFDARQVALGSVAFERLRVAHHGSRILVLEDVEWRRPRLLPARDESILENAEVWFDHGELSLSHREGSGWNFDPPFAQSEAWVARLPRSIRGRGLAVEAQRRSSIEAAALSVEITSPVLMRDGESLVFHGQLESPTRERHLWAHGEVRWTYAAGGEWSAEVQLDDVDLERLPVESWRRVFRFPWPAGLDTSPEGALRGHAFLDWRVSKEASTLDLDHYRLALRIPGLEPLPSALMGHATIGHRRIEWRIAEGVCSRTRIRPSEIHLDLIARSLDGVVRLSDFLDDPALLGELPGAWGRLLGQLPLTGDSALDATVRGSLGEPAASWIEELHLRFQDAAIARGSEDRDALSGEFTVIRSLDGWRLEGVTKDLAIRGVRIPPARWEGRLAEGVLELATRSESAADPHIALALRAERNDAPSAISLSVNAQGLDLAVLTRLPLGPARAHVGFEARWSEADGFRATLRADWRDLEVGNGLAWPVRLPAGKVSGDISLRCEGGEVGVEWIRVLDPGPQGGVWIANGRVLGRSFWDLEGAYFAGAQYLPFPGSIPLLIAEAEERFFCEGELLRWPVPRAR